MKQYDFRRQRHHYKSTFAEKNGLGFQTETESPPALLSISIVEFKDRFFGLLMTNSARDYGSQLWDDKFDLEVEIAACLAVRGFDFI